MSHFEKVAFIHDPWSLCFWCCSNQHEKSGYKEQKSKLDQVTYKHIGIGTNTHHYIAFLNEVMITMDQHPEFDGCYLVMTMHQFINPRPSIPSSGIVGIDTCIFHPIPLSSIRLSNSGRPHRVNAAFNTNVHDSYDSASLITEIRADIGM
ncbi:hypothetical protein DM01DRAFT_1382748 [Hesseltinella vesiculosa]|uniref:Uncharacterized protein n=1 Tax=Hesseltinella vesiculosa TaxID=101127 RepID=A0A1X2G662_9FUNG|nr:hypothetical protein DM01DRAFT_1386343 [Hesseltinella vesiculosa]ORX55614.1 hypothetical protein DM01DRAFT_1382748 [Hesseltinella vesiculosa]